jgi:poly(A) polymerase
LFTWALSGEPPASTSWRERFALPERWRPPKFPLGGADVVALGVPPGPRVGELLRALEGWWIAGGFAADEAALRTRLQQMVVQG